MNFDDETLFSYINFDSCCSGPSPGQANEPARAEILTRRDYQELPVPQSDNDDLYFSAYSSPVCSDIWEEWSDSSPFFYHSTILEEKKEGRDSNAGNLSLSPCTSAIQDFPLLKYNLSSIPSSSSPSISSSYSSSSIPDLHGDSTAQEYSRTVEQGSPVNHTKVKLQRSRENARRMLHSSPGSSESPRYKDHNQDTLSPETSSSESAKAGDNRSKTSRYACRACSKTFARRADIPRHMQSACSVVGKNHLPACDSCGKTYSRPDAIRRHQRNGYCIGKVVPLRKSGRRC